VTFADGSLATYSMADGAEAFGAVLGAGVLACLVLVGIVVGLVTMMRRAVRRRIDRHAPRVRGLVEDAASKARSYTLTGGAGEAARMRSSVRRSLDQTRRVLEAGYAQDGQLSDAVALLRRLDGFAQALDTDLRLAEREPDKARVERELPTLKDRADRIEHAAASLRWAVQDRERHLGEDELERLGIEVDREAAALRAYADENQTGSKRLS
jgi:HAMP domain-containing protein